MMRHCALTACDDSWQSIHQHIDALGMNDKQNKKPCDFVVDASIERNRVVNGRSQDSDPQQKHDVVLGFLLASVDVDQLAAASLARA